MSQNLERRFMPGVHIDQRSTAKPKIIGYAALFDVRSVDLGGFVEEVKPGAFSKSLANGADVRALVEHSGGIMTLGRVKSGTLLIAEDERGLGINIDPPETQTGRDTVELIRRGDLNQMSFSFRTIEDQWHIENGIHVRSLVEVELYDVSIVSFPAYPTTSADLRSFNEIAAEGNQRLTQRSLLAYELDLLEMELGQ